MATPEHLATLRRLALSNELRADHILHAAKERLPGLAETLEDLTKQCRWADNRVRQLHKWAETACTFVRGGYPSLYALGTVAEYRPCVIRMLVELHSPNALRTFLRLVSKALENPHAETELAHETTRALALFSYPPVPASKVNAERIREFLYGYFTLPNADRWWGMKAFAGFGDKHSIKFIQAQPPLEFPFEHITAEILTVLAKRTRTKLVPAPPPPRQIEAQRQTVKRGFAAIIEAETNGDNYDISTEDIIARLKKWQKLCSFDIRNVDYNTLTVSFESLPKNIKAFVQDAFDLCPDLVQNEERTDLAALEKQLPKTKELVLWWD